MNLRDELYPTDTAYEYPNDVISNDNNDMWVVPICEFERFIKYIKHKYPNLEYEHMEYLTRDKKRKDILIGLPRDNSNNIKYCSGHPSDCPYIRTNNSHICEECIKLREKINE